MRRFKEFGTLIDDLCCLVSGNQARDELCMPCLPMRKPNTAGEQRIMFVGEVAPIGQSRRIA